MNKVVNLDQEKRIEVLVARAEGVKQSILAGYKAGEGVPSSVIGSERERFIQNYLSAAYPKPFRFSSGFVIDSNGNQTGQLDIIVENQNALSLPAQSDSEQRLFFAETVSAVISVKSNLLSQWNQVEHELLKIKTIKPVETGTVLLNSPPDYLPTHIVSYSGAKNAETIIKKMSSDDLFACVDSILVLESDLFLTQSKTEIGTWLVTSGDMAFLKFMAALHASITKNYVVGGHIWNYICEVTD